MKTKTQQFFYGSITLDSYNHSTHGRNIEVAQLVDTIRKKLPAEQKNDRFVETYAFAVVYTVSLVFHWQGDVPEHFKALETWWHMYTGGHDALETYLYFNANVPSQIWNDWYEQVVAALEQWKPAHEKMADNWTEDEAADPKYESAELSLIPNG